jgi:ankyrin repeat protein
MSALTDLHAAVRQGNLGVLRSLLEEHSDLANARSETDARGTFPLHVAAEHGQAAAARLLLEHGADVSLADLENDANALCWAAFSHRSTARAAARRGSGSAFPTPRWRTGAGASSCCSALSQGAVR